MFSSLVTWYPVLSQFSPVNILLLWFVSKWSFIRLPYQIIHTFLVFSQILHVRFTVQVDSSSNTPDMYLGVAMFTLYSEVFHEFVQFLLAGARIEPCSKTKPFVTQYHPIIPYSIYYILYSMSYWHHYCISYNKQTKNAHKVNPNINYIECRIQTTVVNWWEQLWPSQQWHAKSGP